MSKKLLIIIGLIIVLLIAGLLIFKKFNPQNNSTDSTKAGEQTTQIGKLNFNYVLDYAEGDCQSISDCTKVDYGCSQTICTNQPANYTTAITDCPLNVNHPTNNSYRCGCVPNEYKCGWLK